MVYYTGLRNTIWALVVPGAVTTWNIILMLNFFRQLPKELEEAAFIDGAGHMTILWRIIVPCSKAVIATVTLFLMVDHWNEWFAGMLYMTKDTKYPLQTYLQFIINSDQASKLKLTAEQLNKINKLSPKTLRAAEIFVAAFPILCVYPFLQKYFVKGIVLGSIKG